ncbi:MAG: DHH family phosphoesterase [Kiritimatiellaeota bacterium]|nr:DHH family phosphoesterase [Kiritimatiellota bacterium]
MLHARQKKTTPAEDILRAFKGAKSILISGHIRTDGDSLGSMIALAHLLNRAGFKAVAAGERREELGAPGFLRGTERLIRPAAAAKMRFDLLVTVDCGAVDRLPPPLQNAVKTCTVVNLDHHVTNTRFGTFNWVDPKASSTGEIVWRLARKAKWALDDIAAEALWVAIITDTGRFAYDMTKPATLRCAADLLRYGVRTPFINDTIYASFSAVNIELKRRAFKTLEILNHGEIASVTLTRKDFEAAGGAKVDAEDVIDIPRSLAGNRVALCFYESRENPLETRVSIRTHTPLDATVLAKRFGGGGHPRAGGCTINAPLRQARKLVLEAVREWLHD